MDAWESVAERKIREAIEAGKFDNLPQKGRPIPLDNNPFEDPSLWMAHHLLRVNGFAPAWIEEANEIDRQAAGLEAELANARQRYGADHAGWKRTLDQLRAQAAELNRRISTYNLKSPSTYFHKKRFELQRHGK